MRKDVHEPHFKEVMAAIPEGFRYVSDKRVMWWREYTFSVDRPIPGYPRGDTFVTSVVCKFGVV